VRQTRPSAETQAARRLLACCRTLALVFAVCLIWASTSARAASPFQTRPDRDAAIACAAGPHVSIAAASADALDKRGTTPRKVHHKRRMRESAERDPAPSALADAPRIQLVALALADPIASSVFRSSVALRALAPRAPPMFDSAS
jgi:hypothetical protein